MEKARARPRGRTPTAVEDREPSAPEPVVAPRPAADLLPSERIRAALRRWLEQEL